MSPIVNSLRKFESPKNLIDPAKRIYRPSLAPWAQEEALGPRVSFLHNWRLDIRIRLRPFFIFMF